MDCRHFRLTKDSRQKYTEMRSHNLIKIPTNIIVNSNKIPVVQTIFQFFIVAETQLNFLTRYHSKWFNISVYF